MAICRDDEWLITELLRLSSHFETVYKLHFIFQEFSYIYLNGKYVNIMKIVNIIKVVNSNLSITWTCKLISPHFTKKIHCTSVITFLVFFVFFVTFSNILLCWWTSCSCVCCLYKVIHFMIVLCCFGLKMWMIVYWKTDIDKMNIFKWRTKI